MHHSILQALLISILLGSAPAAQEDSAKLGHSGHGAAFDEGPRGKPWRMQDIGSTHFPITTSVPEVQEWFDQGNTLLHSFWFYEAERSFRWCVKLDPDCAMAWWGLARAMGRRGFNERARAMLEEALARREQASERERMYLDAWEAAFTPELTGAVEAMDMSPGGSKRLAYELEKIALAYPDDVEAKAMVALYSFYGPHRLGNSLLIDEVLKVEPDHPGAHHYKIHTWDGPEGAQALQSCEVYGKVAPYIGHANHMPGHIYSGIGMWHEGAIWMDSATRVEKRYMAERMIFPFNHWNYAHNRNYLSYIQEQLGLAERALDGAMQLLAAPLDPKYNDPKSASFTIFNQGMIAAIRGLVKFERWDAILDGETLPWRERLLDEAWRGYCECLAHLGKGDVPAAVQDLIAFKKLEKRARDEGGLPFYDTMLLHLRGMVALATGEEPKGLGLLAEAADQQLEDYENDPPAFPLVLSTVLGDAHMQLSSPFLAAMAYERTLATVPNDGFALSGLARALVASGDRAGATRAYGRLLSVWSDADPNLRWLRAAQELGLESAPIDTSPAPQRNYMAEDLSAKGPGVFVPNPAPLLSALDMQGDEVNLEEFRGQNVVLIFFLGGKCVHCVEQLVAIDERSSEFSRRDVQLLAISSDTPEMNRDSAALGEFGFRLLSDVDFENAKRFHSYDDFEDIELHSTIFIDRQGKIAWARTGGDPFLDLDFLLGRIDDSNAAARKRATRGAAASQPASGLAGSGR